MVLDSTKRSIKKRIWLIAEHIALESDDRNR